MHTINKSSKGPLCLEEALKKGLTWEEFYDQNHRGYKEVKQQSIKDQKGECAYTGIYIGEGTRIDEQDIHIDHFYKKSLFPEKRLEWQNLFAAINRRDFGACYKDKNINGPKNIAIKKYEQFWAPTEPNLQKMFRYTSVGEIEPAYNLDENTEKKAKKTIEIYNLKHPHLNHLRKEIIHLIDDYKRDPDISGDEIRAALSQQGFSDLIDFELSQYNS